MKFGVADYGMNVWDGGNYDFERRLLELRAIGFHGTERMEPFDAQDAVFRAATFRKLGMDFATCRCGSVELSIRLTAGLGKEYVWLTPGPQGRDVPMEDFLRRSRRLVEAAAQYGVKCALHNHLGTRIESQEELDLFMESVPDAMLLLDIGHLHGAGGDVSRTIETYIHRLAAVHFKDVFIKDASKGLDRWGERLRFCELGAGNSDTPWSEAARLLKKLGYSKWIFVEHDTHLRDPLIDLKVSLDALKQIIL